MVPSAVIWGGTSSSRTASTNSTVMVLFTTVCTGILTPCLTVAFWLFWVIAFGSDKSFPTPRDSAASMTKSRAKFLEANKYWIPLVGADVPRFKIDGIGPDVPLPTTIGGAGVK